MNYILFANAGFLLCKAPNEGCSLLGRIMGSLGFFNPCAEFGWSKAFILPEQPGEVGLIVYAHFSSYLADREPGLA
jgi:hypothetical protein